MKKTVLLALMMIIAVMAFSQTKVRLTVGDKSITASLVENTATSELVDLLKKAPITIQMSDYGGFEKVGALPQSLPTSNTQITTQPGDIMLYQGNNMVIFYGSNTWSYTRLGKIEDITADELKQFLGNGDIKLTVSLNPSTSINTIATTNDNSQNIYDLKGNKVTERPLPEGIYIIDGKQTIVRN